MIPIIKMDILFGLITFFFRLVFHYYIIYTKENSNTDRSVYSKIGLHAFNYLEFLCIILFVITIEKIVIYITGKYTHTIYLAISFYSVTFLKRLKDLDYAHKGI